MHGSGAVAGIGESTYDKRGESPYTEFQLACIADAALSAGYARHVVVFRALAQGQFRRFGQADGGGGGSAAAGRGAWNGTYGILTAAHQCALRTELWEGYQNDFTAPSR